MSERKIKIFVADPHIIFRQAMKNAVKESKFMVVGEVEHLGDLVSGLKKAKPDLLIADFLFESKKAVEILPEIKAEFPNLKIVMITLALNKNSLLKWIDYLDGFISKATSGEHLLAALEEISNGSFYYFIPKHQ